ncbi:MAG: Hsp70 family protein [Myxococcota bacterium]
MFVTHWALDLGTTNTVLARWDAELGRPEVVHLPEVCRDPSGEPPFTAPSAIPSATHLVADESFWAQLGRLPMVARHTFWGRQAWIGRAALERNVTTMHPAFVQSFKALLPHEAVRPIARLGPRLFSARDVVRAYTRELLAEVQRTTGERIRRLTVTVPVDAYEGYRAEIREALATLGVRVNRFVDEPVAAAAGYGLAIQQKRHVLVVDFGGGTLDLAWVEIDARAVESGRGRVLAKAGRSLGGDHVDRWLLQDICHRLGTRVPEDAFWRRLLIDETRWVKEQLFHKDREPFTMRPPGHAAEIDARLRGEALELEVTRKDLVRLLEQRGVYQTLTDCFDEVERNAIAGHAPAVPDDVLMVGGSTLLPGVFPLVEARYGRDRVRAWQPFQAVANGACTLTARGFAPADFIVHDYAMVVYDPQTGARQTTTIVPAGTRFPTAPDLWRRSLVPTCPMGEPERIFKLVICEIGRAEPGAVGWDETGRLRAMSEDGELVVPLNDSNPVLGFLDPPHQPGDRHPRLDVRFGIDQDRWLTATVTDLKTSRMLLIREPVVRLL